MIVQINKLEILEKLKRRHGIVGNLQDELLTDFIDDTVDHYLAIASDLAGVVKEQVPSGHSFIITDVASKRYIRRGSEGLTIERVDQYLAQYEEPTKDFAEYLSIMQNMYEDKKDAGDKGRVVFY